jgi:hypothetical protein
MATFAQDDDGVVVIIGSGAGGGTLANALAKQKIRSVVLEAGKRHTLEDIENDEWAMFKKISWLDKRQAAGGWHLTENNPTLPAWIVKGVGGSTVHWAGIALRFRDFEFKMQSINWRHRRRQPARLAGDAGGDGALVREGREAHGRDRAEHRHGLSPLAQLFKVLATGAKRVGYKEILSGPMAINTEPYDDRAACQQLGFCMQGCKMGAKWSTLYTDIPRAEASGYCEVRPQSMVLRIEHDAKGRANAVVYADASGTIQRQKARVVCVAATPSSRRACCSTPPRQCSQTGWPTPPARSGATT